MSSLLEKLTDNELYDLFLKGRQEVMGIIVKRNSPKLFGFLFRMVPDRSVCEEMVQETFLKMVRQRPDFSSGTKVSTYLFSVARNLAIDEIRKRRLRKHISLDQSTPEESRRGLQDRLTDGAPPVDCQAENRQLREKIERALENLPSEQREVFCLREMEGLGFAQIAEITGCSENTVKSRMRYALEKLRRIFEEEM